MTHDPSDGHGSHKPTFRIEWWRSEADNDFYARAVCTQNGEEVWRQSEGLKKLSEVKRRVADLFQMRWELMKRRDP